MIEGIDNVELCGAASPIQSGTWSFIAGVEKK